ncbi:hypothetical protein ACKKBG_A36795 [Auxenochlorella protothecoides x Auxenochlorella symbiontica]
MCEGQPATKRAKRDCRAEGLGSLAVLNDECIIDVLHLLSGRYLAQLATVSRCLYFYTAHNELWKGLVLETLGDAWTFRDSWKETYAWHVCPGHRPYAPPRTLNPRGFHSEFLYRSWLCAHMVIDSAWLETENVPRRSGLTLQQFREEYELPNRPVILTDVVTKWPAMQKWGREYLAEKLAGHSVLVGDAPMSFEGYCAYADAQSDELPLYLFDKGFAERCPDLGADYQVPEVFSEDLFAVLGPGRPDHRWLIVGPARSGSTFHQDPNATCAWNAVVRGSKKWVMYPPHATPPGVRPSADGADVASPVSLTEWFLSFYDHRAAGGRAPAECVVRPGEVLFVPRQWWHLAINLEESIAVTQNYVSTANLRHVLAFLSSRNPALVSGLEGDERRASLHDDFLAALKEVRPQALADSAALEAEELSRAQATHKLSSLFREGRTGESSNLTSPDQGATPAIRFGFA